MWYSPRFELSIVLGKDTKMRGPEKYSGPYLEV